MQTITFGQCVIGTWKDSIRVVVKRPLMLLILFVILACANYAKLVLSKAAKVDSFDWQGVKTSVSLLYIMVHCAVIFGLSVQVMRQSLLSKTEFDSSAFFDESFWRYVGVNFLTGALGFVMIRIIVGGASIDLDNGLLLLGYFLLGLIFMCAFFFIYIRQTVLYCHIAVGRRAGWRIAWSDTRGHFWMIWATLLVAGLPLWVFTVFNLVGLYKAESHAATSIWTFPLAISSALSGIIGTVVYAAGSAWVYRRFASRLVVIRVSDY